ncbi:methyl-cpg dna binding [Holotrichia oblita]|uniref:Methyl-cpg dna binding n=1 Tax=Holotrichia oblita TaxID=644536 RepID=A0ACB9T9R8_HOLOL|nr:methyl-cpg dna binding [Holotrichia oblita]
METTQPSKRKNRSKSTSSNKSPTEPAEHTETAPNLNGNKDGGSEEQETANNDKPTEETTTDENKPTQGRKRKASEMKSDSSGGEETPVEKETKEITEPEKKVEVKVEPELSDSPTDPKKDDITMPPKQTLGKGKRARIPNKRYSDIMITSPKLEKIRKVENGEVQDNTNITEKENTIESDNSIGSSLKSTKDSLGTSRNSTSSPSGHSSKRQKFPVDLTNPNYLKPFQFGWKRELVYRATTDSTMKRNGDIYYYTPNGKKVRSMREVSENLKNKELSLDDFTFYKEPLGLDDPEKEIIRDAKVKYGSTKEHTPKTTPRVKVASPKPPPPAPTTRTPTPPATAPASETPKSTKNSAKTGGGFKVKLPNKAAAPKGKVDRKQKENEAEMEVGTYPPSWITPQTKTKTGTTKWGNNYMNNQLNRNCQLRQQPGAASIQALLPPPPLTPISTIKSAAAAATTSSTCPSTVSVPPKLQRIPKPQDTNITNTPQIVKPLPPVPKPDLPKLTPRPGLTSVPKFIKVNNISEQSASESKSLVGSVTTWFPPSSTIQVANDQTRVNDVDAHSPPRPQFVEFLGNKKYLIVPKHNILSVSPAIASVNSKSEDFVTTPDLLNMGSDNVDEIIAEAAKIPPSPRLSAEEIKSEPHSPAHLTHPDDNLPEPMDVDTPPSIPMEIDPPDPEPQKDEHFESDIAAAATIVSGEDSNNIGNVTVNEVIERKDGLGENMQDTQQSPPPDIPKEEDAATANLKDLQDQEQESTGSDQEYAKKYELSELYQSCFMKNRKKLLLQLDASESKSRISNSNLCVPQNCQLRQQPGAASIQALLPPPPLTPISTIKSAAAAATTSSTCPSTVSVPPKLQRIPKPQDTNITNTPQIVKPLPPVPKPDLPKLTPRPGLTSVPKFIKVNNISEQSASESKSLVGSVTTWFPPSSTIQVANDQTRVNDVDAHSPLDRISPAIASVNSKSEDFVTTPDLLNMGSDNVDEIIAEAAKIPPSPRLSAEEIKSEPHSPAHLTHPDDNLPEPMDVDTPPSIPMEIVLLTRASKG